MRFERTTPSVGGLWCKLINPVFKPLLVGVAQNGKGNRTAFKALCHKAFRDVFMFQRNSSQIVVMGGLV